MCFFCPNVLDIIYLATLFAKQKQKMKNQENSFKCYFPKVNWKVNSIITSDIGED